MSNRNGFLSLALVPLLFAGCVKDEATAAEHEPLRDQTLAVETPKAAPRTVVDPSGDNTKRNAEGDVGQSPTADDQSNAKSDVDLTREIRRSLTADDSLSTYAHNVKIITRDGHVILKGPVRSAGEKSTVEARARQIAGVSAVTSELVVTSH